MYGTSVILYYGMCILQGSTICGGKGGLELFVTNIYPEQKKNKNWWLFLRHKTQVLPLKAFFVSRRVEEHLSDN